jgi:ABC-type uncharacterized transport system permease subunit
MILSGASTLAWILGILAILAYVLPAARRTLGPRSARIALLAAWVLHGALLAVALLGLDQADAGGARFGFGPAVSTTAWLVLTVYALESRFYPQLQSRTVLAGLGAVAVLLGVWFPGSVLHARASLWLPLHWVLGIASYALFAAAVVHAWLMTRSEAQMRLGAAGDASQVGVPLMTLERLMFAFVMAGFVLLSATLLVGWLFSESLYGAGIAWRWNHKTIFSVLSWLRFCCGAAGNGVGAASAPCACCTRVQASCCWPMSVRVLYWKFFCNGHHEIFNRRSGSGGRVLDLAQESPKRPSAANKAAAC